ncbi:MAG: hypothetical protein ACREYC_24025 [Gammaproteobacteria bacterium]
MTGNKRAARGYALRRSVITGPEDGLTRSASRTSGCRRPLTLDMIHRLAEGLWIPIGVPIRPYRPNRSPRLLRLTFKAGKRGPIV